MKDVAIHFKKNIISYLCISVFAVFSMDVFAPFELYLSNKSFFFFEGYELVPLSAMILVAGVVILIVGLFICALFSEKIAGEMAKVIFLISLALYIQGNYLPSNYGALNGEKIDWSQYTGEGIISVLTFVIIIVGGIIVAHVVRNDSWNKLVTTVSICIVLVQVVTLVTLMIQNGGLGKTDPYLATTEGQMDYSKDENLVIIMLDSFEGSVLSEVLQGENSQKYEDMLEDFTFYPDTLGMYRSTVFALPYLMNGVEYLNDSTYEEFLEKSYKESKLLNGLVANDWNIGIYNANRIPASEICTVAKNCKKVELTVSSHRRLGEYMFKLVAFRYVPQPLKHYFWFYADDINTGLKDTKNDIELYSDINFAFEDSFSNINSSSEKKSFRLYELLGAHVPYHINSEFEEAGYETDEYETARGLIKMLNEYTAKLKEQGVYDNTTLIVLADHGEDNRFNPLFMVKYAGVSHPLRVSNLAFSHTYLQDIYQEIITGGSEKECENIITKHRGENRRYLLYDENDGINERDYFTADIYVGVATGEAYNKGNLYMTTEVYKCAE